MSSARDLQFLLENIEPRHVPGEFVFSSVNLETLRAFKDIPLLTFKEPEGVTIVVSKEVADMHSLSYDNTWGLITLAVHSDLESIGFLAAVTNALANSGISVNAVSAYYHDHLFVPYSKVYDALTLLEELPEPKAR